MAKTSCIWQSFRTTGMEICKYEADEWSLVPNREREDPANVKIRSLVNMTAQMIVPQMIDLRLGLQIVAL